jgi:hypothetical protein
MPNAETALALVESAAKCSATCFGSPARSRNHERAVSALVMVSWVVKVFDATRNSVVPGFTFFSVSAMCVPSTLDTKWEVMPGSLYGRRASVTMTGPRSEPPMPMLTTSVMALPV